MYVLLAVLWGIIFLTFSVLAIMHWTWSRFGFVPLKFKGKVAKINSIPLGIAETVEDINGFIATFNNHNQKSNRAQFFGYAAAAITALISLTMSMVQLVP